MKFSCVRELIFKSAVGTKIVNAPTNERGGQRRPRYPLPRRPDARGYARRPPAIRTHGYDYNYDIVVRDSWSTQLWLSLPRVQINSTATFSSAGFLVSCIRSNRILLELHVGSFVRGCLPRFRHSSERFLKSGLKSSLPSSWSPRARAYVGGAPKLREGECVHVMFDRALFPHASACDAASYYVIFLKN
jgi:hypothetical protein